jgi:hypothetical protein
MPGERIGSWFGAEVRTIPHISPTISVAALGPSRDIFPFFLTN